VVRRPVIDHVTTIVRDLDATTGALGRVLRSTAVQESRIPGILVSTFTLAGSELHVVTPRGPGPVADFLDGGGRGLHHLAVRFDDLDAALAELRGAGIRALGEPVEMLPGVREVFLDPQQTGGLLIQAVERRGRGVIPDS
jgi:methylmalonyl-CoA/ethylmalonyl-CoA epimerase